MFEVNKYIESLSHNLIGFNSACGSSLLFCCVLMTIYIVIYVLYCIYVYDIVCRHACMLSAVYAFCVCVHVRTH